MIHKKTNPWITKALFKYLYNSHNQVIIHNLSNSKYNQAVKLYHALSTRHGMLYFNYCYNEQELFSIHKIFTMKNKIKQTKLFCKILHTVQYCKIVSISSSDFL